MSVSPDVLESLGTGIDMGLQIHNDLDWVSIQQTTRKQDLGSSMSKQESNQRKEYYQ
jgi:hypothetical protein